MPLDHDGQPEALLGAVGLKLPPFWKHDPELWFVQAEAQFATRNITVENTKYAHVISTLSPEVAQDIRDILVAPPAIEPYATLKQTLIARTTESEQRRVQMLLDEEELGDRKPSKFLRRMEQLVGDQRIDKGILRQLFLKRMPPDVKLILASTSDTLPISELATLADKIVEAHVPPVNSVSETHLGVAPIRSNPPDDIKASPQSGLAEQVTVLTKLVKDLSITVKRLQRDRSRSRNRNDQRKPRDPTPADNVDEDAQHCWYHRRYGAQAHRCKSPCTWTAQGND